MNAFKVCTVGLVALALAACAADPAEESPFGPVVGTEFEADEAMPAEAAGVPAGTYVGSGLGPDLVPDDRTYMRRYTQDALEYNRLWQLSAWRNPVSGANGTVMPVRTYRSDQGQHCREFETTLSVDGDDPQRAIRRACRESDGTWRLIP